MHNDSVAAPRHHGEPSCVYPHPETVIAAIQQLAATGIRVNGRHMRKLDRPLLDAAILHFGSWPRALAAAGIDPKAVTNRRTWTLPRLIDAIRDLHRRGAPLNYASVLKVDGGLPQAAIKLAGSWREALRAAGYDPEALRVNRCPWTRDQILDLIRRRAKAGLPITSYGVRPLSAEVASRRLFGSWKKALRAAGVANPMTEFPVWTKVSVVEAILLRQELGQPLHCLAVAKQASRLYDAARRCFGSWHEALSAAGIDPASVQRTRRPWTRDEIVEELRRCARTSKKEHRPDYSAEAFVKAARRLFGSWQAALDAAGVARQRCPNWQSLGSASSRA